MLFFGEQVRMVLCYILRLLHVCLCRGIARELELLRQYTRSSQLLSCKSGTADNCKIDKATKYMQHCQSLVILDDGKLEIVRVQKYQKTRYCRNKNQEYKICDGIHGSESCPCAKRPTDLVQRPKYARHYKVASPQNFCQKNEHQTRNK